MRYAVRRLLHQPGFSLVVILTLALGIGANTAIFSLVNAVLVKPLPFDHPERLVTLNHFYPSLNSLEAGFAVPTFHDISERTQLFESFAAIGVWNANLTDGGDPEKLAGAVATHQYFTVFGVAPLLGRTFAANEDTAGHEHVVVLGYGLWQRRFGADRNIVGRKIVLDGEPYDVIGVMPPGFDGFFDRRTELWAPVVFKPNLYDDFHRTNEFLVSVGRVKAGVELEQARRDVAAFAEALKHDHPQFYPQDWTIHTRSLDAYATEKVRPALLVLLGAVGLVLLIACANIANLLLARSAARTREMAVRAAVGATRPALIKQLLAESVLLSLAGAAVGLLIAIGAIRGLIALAPMDTPRTDAIHIDGTVLLYTLAIALGTGLLFGFAPAITASRADLQHALKDGARTAGERRGQWLRRGLVVVEIALALTLLVGAGLLLKSFARLQGVSPGFDPTHLLTMTIALPDAKYKEAPLRIAFFRAVHDRIAAIPGVVSVGATSNIPFGKNFGTSSFSVEGYQPPKGQPSPWGDVRETLPGFFETLKVPLIRGRTIAESDRADVPQVVVVDEEAARHFWPGVDPIGKRITFDVISQKDAKWVTVVGVVGHIAHEGLDAERRVQLHFPHAQWGQAEMGFIVRTAGEPTAVVNAVRAAVREIDRDQPIADVFTMDTLMDRAVGQRRLSMTLLGTFASLAMVLAALGIYGVTAFDVTQRSREIGVRMALGAARSNVLAMVLKQGLTIAAVGVVVGILGALLVTRVLQTQLFGIASTDPVTFASVAVGLLGVAALAILLPAMRATRVNPVEALRYE